MGAADHLASLDAEVESLLAEGRAYDTVGCLDGALGVIARTPEDAIAAGTRLLRQRDMEGAARLADFAAIAPDNIEVQSLRRLLNRHNL